MVKYKNIFIIIITKKVNNFNLSLETNRLNVTQHTFFEMRLTNIFNLSWTCPKQFMTSRLTRCCHAASSWPQTISSLAIFYEQTFNLKIKDQGNLPSSNATHDERDEECDEDEWDKDY